MSKFAVVLACLSLLTLSSCGNTARGLKQDGVQTSHALDNATHNVLSAGAGRRR
ncbi:MULTISPECIES: entericidin [unclassified Sinorhizobium]|uniref:entericidin n=1 Tax=unclassified Sinorhizobium TaxID=2613772 RepID=UPI003526117A